MSGRLGQAFDYAIELELNGNDTPMERVPPILPLNKSVAARADHKSRVNQLLKLVLKLSLGKEVQELSLQSIDRYTSTRFDLGNPS